jgi:hypothetical protein
VGLKLIFRIVTRAEFPAGVNTYRAYRLPWPAFPFRQHHLVSVW